MRDIIFSTILFFLLGWFFILFVGNVDYGARKLAVSNIAYRYTQTAGKKGEMNETIYHELEDKLQYYGDFTISLRAERFEDGGVTILENGDVIGLDLRESGFDILTVSVISNKSHWLSAVTELSPLIRQAADFRMIGNAAVYVQ